MKQHILGDSLYSTRGIAKQHHHSQSSEWEMKITETGELQTTQFIFVPFCVRLLLLGAAFGIM